MAEVKNPTLEELAQKLFTEAGYPGDVYESDPVRLKYFEAKAQAILEEE